MVSFLRERGLRKLHEARKTKRRQDVDQSLDLGEFHRCFRWWDRGMKCPMKVFKEHVEDGPPVGDRNGLPRENGKEVRKGDPPDDEDPGAPAIGVPERRRDRANIMSQAEEVVAAAAPAIPSEVRGKSLADSLKERGPTAVGVGVGAAFAVRAVARGFAGGGFHFPQVFDPLRPVRVR